MVIFQVECAAQPRPDVVIRARPIQVIVELVEKLLRIRCRLPEEQEDKAAKKSHARSAAEWKEVVKWPAGPDVTVEVDSTVRKVTSNSVPLASDLTSRKSPPWRRAS